VTYSIGQVLLHLFAMSDPMPIAPLSGDDKEPIWVEGSIPMARGNWSAGLSRIWQLPSGPVSWPPEKAFDDEHFVYLADRWNPQEPPSPETTPQVADIT
jgi:hypothetical protein